MRANLHCQLEWIQNHLGDIQFYLWGCSQEGLAEGKLSCGWHFPTDWHPRLSRGARRKKVS